MQQLDIAAHSDRGRVRENNEDSYRIIAPLQLLVLADGMGGGAHGEVASAMVVDIVAEHCQQAASEPDLPLLERRLELSEPANRLINAIHLANQKVFEAAQGHAGMGATVLAAWIQEDQFSLAHVGDSRAYLFRGGALEQLTADHSLVAEQVRRGLITPQQATTSVLQSVLIRAVGAQEQVQIDATDGVLLEGDALLLCSDGLTRMVPEDRIADILEAANSSQEAAGRLVELANRHGGEDNVTVMVCRALGRPSSWLSKLRQRVPLH